MNISPWNSLSNLLGDGPTPRAAHSCEIIGNKLLFFGGWNGKKALNDLYVLNLDNLTW